MTNYDCQKDKVIIECQIRVIYNNLLKNITLIFFSIITGVENLWFFIFFLITIKNQNKRLTEMGRKVTLGEFI